jgi:Tol biopolymer transport system component/beta-lactamase regulating signal transducer with metallopeptidase domain
MNGLTSSSWRWICIWQSTLFLGLGGLLSLLWRHRPARAHRILVLAMAACLTTPLMSQTVRHHGWGLLRPHRALHVPAVLPAPSPTVAASLVPASAPTSQPTNSPPSPAVTNAIMEGPSPHIHFSWEKVLVTAWVTLSALVLLRLVVSLLREVILLRRATPLQDETILRALNRAIDHLNLPVRPAVRVSEHVSSPVICCWGTRPTLVVPHIRPSADTPEAWLGILCHELAHWKRKDHWAFLVSEFLGCWLPWHPLVWWTRRRLDQLSELACDDWVLACGQPAQIYAESLLSLLPQRRAVCALPAVSLRTKLERRIHNIMADRRANPLPGRRWAWSSLAIAVAVAAVAAFAQSASVPQSAAVQPVQGQADYTPSGMTLRLVDKGYYSDLTSCPSRNGKYICTANVDADGWMVRDRATGKERLLMSDPSGFTFVSVISPDNRYVVYEWMERTTQLAKELRLIGLDGGAPSVVYTNAASVYLNPVQWSEDGRAVLALVKTADDNQAILVDVAASSGKLLRSFGGYSPGLALSPDARYLAYDRPQEKDSPKGDLFLWDCRDEQEIPLVTHPANERLLGWSPDGKWILFSSDRSGTVDLWMLPMGSGRCVDSPKLVQRAIGTIKPKGFLADGSFYYASEYRMGDVYTAAVDFDKGELTEPPSPVPYAGLKNGSEWSPDGRFLASGLFDDNPRGRGPRSLTLLDWETRHVQTVVPDNLADFGPIYWGPDSHAILTRATANDTKRKGIYRIDVPSGKTTALVPDVQTYLVNITPDGKTLVYWRGPDGAAKTSQCLVVQPVESGEARVLYTHPQLEAHCMAISPSGHEVAFGLQEPDEKVMDIKAISLQGGTPRQIYRYAGKGRVIWLEWHPDGRSILFLVAEDAKDAQVALWQVPAQGGSARQITKPFRGMNWLRVHPDGKRIAFSSQMVLQHEVWVMEHFLPK